MGDFPHLSRHRTLQPRPPVAQGVCHLATFWYVLAMHDDHDDDVDEAVLEQQGRGHFADVAQLKGRSGCE